MEEFSGYPFKEKEKLVEPKNLDLLVAIGENLNEILEGGSSGGHGDLFELTEQIMQQVLSERDIDILKMYFGMEEYFGQKFTFKQIGKKYGINEMTARLAKNRSIEKISVRARWLRSMASSK